METVNGVSVGTTAMNSSSNIRIRSKHINQPTKRTLMMVSMVKFLLKMLVMQEQQLKQLITNTIPRVRPTPSLLKKTLMKRKLQLKYIIHQVEEVTL